MASQSNNDHDSQLSRLQAENRELKRILADSLERIVEEEHIGRVFHDFNNILSSSMGYASLARERAESSNDEKLERFLHNIERSGIRARDLVRASLARRQDVRSRAQTDIKTLAAYFPEAIYHGPDSGGVSISASALHFVMSLMARRYQGDGPLRIRAEATHEGEEQCRACSEELRGQQLRVSCLFAAQQPQTQEHDADLALCRALVASNGGHLCDSLVQEREFDVYLKAVV